MSGPFPVNPLPYVTPELPGIGGRLKADPAQFVVEEIPLYEPCGQGEHVYVRITRQGWTTHDLAKRLAALFGLKDIHVGVAGLKDKHALSTQTISLTIHGVSEAEVAARIAGELPVQVLWARRHGNKLKRGHLLGNRFRIVVMQPAKDCLERSQSIAEALGERGVPNFYGPQRFGATGDNAEKGLEIVRGKRPRKAWLTRFLTGAFQAGLFNAWLVERMQRGWYPRLLAGDIAKKAGSGALFQVADLAAELPRFQAREIGYTGPIYGEKLLWAAGEPGDLERAVLARAELDERALGRAKLPGTRRPGRLFLPDLAIRKPDFHGLEFEFSLPKGAYATTVLREFMKIDADLPDDGGGEED